MILNVQGMSKFCQRTYKMSSDENIQDRRFPFQMTRRQILIIGARAGGTLRCYQATHRTLGPWTALVFLKTKQNGNLNHLCLEIKIDHNFSNMWKDKLLGSLPAWPGLRVSHSQEAPRSWRHKAPMAIILLCSPGAGSGADPSVWLLPRFLALQHSQVLTDTFCSQNGPQPALQSNWTAP